VTDHLIETDDGLRLLGLGYQRHTLASLIDSLCDAGVRRLVDVRQHPVSRKPGFSKTVLSRAMQAAGICYEHRPELGNPRDNRPGFHAGPAQLAAAKARYAQLLTQPAAVAAIDALITAALREVVAVLCLEADPRHCHRSVLLATAATRAAGRRLAGG
jgi:uncharacterized protein (DUF488 family)